MKNGVFGKGFDSTNAAIERIGTYAQRPLTDRRCPMRLANDNNKNPEVFMSATSLSIDYPNQVSKLSVSFRFLLVLYGIIPVCLLVLWLDKVAFDSALRAWLPSSPGHFLLFQLFFGTPHIIASNLLLLSNADYVQTFKHKLIGMTMFIALFFGVGSLVIPYQVLYIISACWTVYHVLKQQLGIAKPICRLPNWAFNMQLLSCVSAGIAVYLGVFLKNSLSDTQAAMVAEIARGLTLVLLLVTLVCHRHVVSRFGHAFLWANSLLVMCTWYVYSEGYYFLAILMPRLIHDISAYSFYITHDVNRHGEQPRNTLFSLARICHLPVAWVLPVLSFALTYVLQAYGDVWVNLILQYLFATQIYKVVTLGLIGYLALMHYYTEAFIWAAESPLRRYIRFSGL